MTAIQSYTPGLAASSEDAFTQTNTKWTKPPTRNSYGSVFSDIAENTLVGRVTETGELIASAFAAADGSQNPIGVTTHAVAVNDSNSAPDSNSEASSHANRVGFYTDGEFNYDVLVKGAGWTLDLLRANLEANGQGFGVDVIQTATPDQSQIES